MPIERPKDTGERGALYIFIYIGGIQKASKLVYTKR